MTKKIVDIIVTYNRKKLLKENLQALLNQTYTEHDIMIIDNNSDDGTRDMIKKNYSNYDNVIYYNTGKNLGGAGGFAFGLEKAIQIGYEYAWIMDDDSIPQSDALESIMNKVAILKNDFSYISSYIKWKDNSLCVMNIPAVNFDKFENHFENIKNHHLIPINSCSFVGCFLNLKKVYKLGLPIAEFFIYGDDVEYTKRIRKIALAYLDLDSVIIHKIPYNIGADLISVPSERIDRYYYQSRNGIYIAKKNHSIIRRLYTVFKMIIRILLQSENDKFKRIAVLIKGTLAGIFFNPKIKYVRFGEKNEK